MNTLDYDFLHKLYNTLLLLGAPKRIADLAMKAKDGAVTEIDVDELGKYNCELFGLAKARLADLTTIKIKPL